MTPNILQIQEQAELCVINQNYETAYKLLDQAYSQQYISKNILLLKLLAAELSQNQSYVLTTIQQIYETCATQQDFTINQLRQTANFDNIIELLDKLDDQSYELGSKFIGFQGFQFQEPILSSQNSSQKQQSQLQLQQSIISELLNSLAHDEGQNNNNIDKYDDKDQHKDDNINYGSNDTINQQQQQQQQNNYRYQEQQQTIQQQQNIESDQLSDQQIQQQQQILQQQQWEQQQRLQQQKEQETIQQAQELMDNQQYAQAIQELQELNFNNHQVIHMIFTCLKRCKRYEEIVNLSLIYKDILQADDLSLLAYSLAKINKIEDAVKVYNECESKYQNIPASMLFNKSLCLFRLGILNEAYKYVNLVLQKEPNMQEALQLKQQIEQFQ